RGCRRGPGGRRARRLALAHARAETLNLARYPAYSVPTVALPATLLLLFGRQSHRGAPDRLLAGLAATALLTVAFFQFGVGVAAGRTLPWETYLRTLPVSPTTRLTGSGARSPRFAAR